MARTSDFDHALSAGTPEAPQEPADADPVAEALEDTPDVSEAASEADVAAPPVSVRLAEDFDVPSDSDPVRVSVGAREVTLPVNGDAVTVPAEDAVFLLDSPAVEAAD